MFGFGLRKQQRNYTEEFNDYGLAVLVRRGKKGVINKADKEIVLPIFDEVDAFRRDGHIEVQLKGKKGLFDENGNLLIRPKYTELDDNEYSIEKGIIIAKLSNKTGCLNLKGEEIIPFRYNSLSYTKGGYIEAEIKGKHGIIDMNNKVLIPIKYDYVNNYYEDLTMVKFEDKYGIIDIEGKAILPIEYDLISDFTNDFYDDGRNLAKLLKDGKYGVINERCEPVIPVIYDDLLYFHDKFIVVKLDNKYGVIDYTNNIVIPIVNKDLSFTEEDSHCKYMNYSINTLSGTTEAYFNDLFGMGGLVKDYFKGDIPNRYVKQVPPFDGFGGGMGMMGGIGFGGLMYDKENENKACEATLEIINNLTEDDFNS